MKLYGKAACDEKMENPTRGYVRHRRKYQKKVHREERKGVRKELNEFVEELNRQ